MTFDSCSCDSIIIFCQILYSKLDVKYESYVYFQDNANMEFLLVYALKVEKVLGKLGEIPFEPLMEEQKEMMQST